jgi:FkbM family methyltransferase
MKAARKSQHSRVVSLFALVANNFRIERILKLLLLTLLPRNRVICLKIQSNLWMYGKNKSGFGLRGAYVFGFEDEPEILNLDFFLKSGDTFIDVGCSTGIYSLYASRICGEFGKIVSIDANPDMITCLEKSAARNHMANLQCLTTGVSSSNEELQFYSNSSKPNSFSFVKQDKDAISTTAKVKSLDSIAKELNLQDIAYIKIDVEGFEENVLLGASEIIRASQPVIQIEDTFGFPSTIPTMYSIWKIDKSPNCVLIPRAKVEGHNYRSTLAQMNFRELRSNRE